VACRKDLASNDKINTYTLGCKLFKKHFLRTAGAIFFTEIENKKFQSYINSSEFKVLATSPSIPAITCI
jgi:hypothetical protein